ncbi:hypothetical protein HYPSUDRAFT_53533 [Hypholoma sublateritium FD-334 SS-4]|uniref:Uncharacterized protein n=1 Tax=Hypholoma sublateritium (strain FD-334 SS-4) TaxID=945553 RepID=A0A0D2MLM0_HYPSF|nr:hypothetical protein HYPSUDRAFT_53533 [Hypholoma sublateritium FD-334 SS-4]
MPSLTAISAPGFAFVTATAILVNPHSITGTKSMIFDAQLYIGPNPHNILLGSLHYFNLSSHLFSPDPQLYQLHFTIARWEPGTEVHPLGPPGPRYLIQPPDDASNLEPKELNVSEASLADNANDIYEPDPAAKQHLGPKEWPSFTIDPCEQPIIYADSANKQATPCLCTFADIGKYKNSKPTPYDNRIMTFYGRITGVKNQTVSDEECVDYFKVELQSIHFCGLVFDESANIVFCSVRTVFWTNWKNIVCSQHTIKGESASPKTPQTPTPSYTNQKRDHDVLEPVAGMGREGKGREGKGWAWKG